MVVGGLKADVNFHTPSDPVRVKVIRIIRSPACEPHREHLSFEGVLTMTGRPRHGGNSDAFLSLSLQHRADFLQNGCDTHVPKKKEKRKKPQRNHPVAGGAVNGEVQRNGATMLSAA